MWTGRMRMSPHDDDGYLEDDEDYLDDHEREARREEEERTARIDDRLMEAEDRGREPGRRRMGRLDHPRLRDRGQGRRLERHSRALSPWPRPARLRRASGHYPGRQGGRARRSKTPGVFPPLHSVNCVNLRPRPHTLWSGANGNTRRPTRHPHEPR